MYVKTGCLPYARIVFDTMDKKNIVAWNSLISGLSYAGLLKDAEALMSKMEKGSNLMLLHGTIWFLGMRLGGKLRKLWL